MAQSKESPPPAPAPEDDVLLEPGKIADPASAVSRLVPADILRMYEVHSYRNAALILKESQGVLFSQLMTMLGAFRIERKMILEPGGNESRIVKRVSAMLRQKGWHETTISGDLEVNRDWREVDTSGKKPKTVKKNESYRRRGFLDGHKIDFVQGKVAFDLEWNSKDQTFDRDLYAFRAFYEAGAIDVAVILTRGISLDANFFRSLGNRLNKDGTSGTTGVASKYGASTTWMGKLLYRLEAGRNRGCPVLAVGITPDIVSD